jgi:hypothetical protein
MHLYRFTFAVGLAAGFIAGTRAGRERYDQMIKMAKATKDSPAFQQAAGAVQAQATGLLSSAGHMVADSFPQLAHTAMDHVPLLRHRDGDGDSSGNGKTGADNGRPFAATPNSHLKQSGRKEGS